MPPLSKKDQDDLLALGENPADYETPVEIIDGEEYEVVEETPPTKLSSPLTKSQNPQQKQYGAFETLVSQAAASVLPTVGGLAGGAVGGLTGPGAIVASPALGFAGAYGTEKAQAAILDKINPDINLALQAQRQQRPLLSTGANILGGMSMLKGDLKSLKGAGRAVKDLVTKGSSGKKDLGNLINVGTAAALPSGFELALSEIEDRPIDFKSLALNTIGNTVLNAPNKIAQKIPGVHANQYQERFMDDSSVSKIKESSAIVDAVAKDKPPVLSNKLIEELKLEDLTSLAGETGYNPETGKPLKEINQKDPFKEAQAKAAAEAKLNNKIAAAEVAAQKRAEAEAAKYKAEIELENVKKQKEAADLAKAQGESEQLRQDALVATKTPDKTIDQSQAVYDIEAPARDAKAKEDAAVAMAADDRGITKQFSKPAPIVGQKPEPLIPAAKSSDIIPAAKPIAKQPEVIPVPSVGDGKNKGSFGIRKEEPAPKTKPALDEAIAQEESTLAAITDPAIRVKQQQKLDELKKAAVTYREQPASEIGKGASEKGVPVKPTVEWKRLFDKLGDKRNVKVTDTGDLVSPVTGKQITGIAYLREGLNSALAKINVKREGWDTRAHEIFHPLYNDLKNSPRKSDNALHAKIEQQVKDMPEFQQSGKGTVEEFLTSKVGEDTVRRVFSTDNKGPVSEFFRDAWANIKSRYSKRATAEDYTRLLSNKLLYDAPFNETFKAGSGAAGAGAVPASETKVENPALASLPKNSVFQEQGSSSLADSMRKAADDATTPVPDAPLSEDARVAERQKNLKSATDEERRRPSSFREQEESELRKQADTPEFKNWFGDSKIVDAEGKPLVLYHGTNADVTQFKQSKEGSLGSGIYFTQQPEFASSYATKDQYGQKRAQGGNVIPVFISAKNPIELKHFFDGDVDPIAVQAFTKLGMSRDKAIKTFDSLIEEKGNVGKQIATRLQNAGYDSIIVKNKNGVITEAVIYNPAQIKSSIGNKGTFDPSNPDIREQEESGLFINSSERLLDKPNVLKLTTDKDGTYPGINLKARLEKSIPADEWSALKDAGIEDYFNKNQRVDKEDLKKWIQENGPKLEVKELKANLSEPSEEYKQYYALQHEFETNGIQPVRNLNDKIDHWKYQGRRANPKDMQSPWAQKMLEYERLAPIVFKEEYTPSNDPDSATSRFTQVNPKPLAEMPGAVDLLVRVPLKDMKGSKGQNIGSDKSIKFSGSHFGDSDKNVVASVRGYMETDSSTGKKVFHVFEVQSDWAQQVREEVAGRKEHAAARGVPYRKEDYRPDRSDPSLNHYEQLGLKAAINHAIKSGADEIAISDGKTAMMTEQHDRAAAIYLLPTQNNIEILTRLYDLGPDVNKLKEGKKIHLYSSADTRDIKELGGDLETIISQRKGMELHYDNSLPNRLAKLTESTGRNINFGKHQNGPSEAFGGKSDITGKSYPLDSIKAKLADEMGGKFSSFARFQEESELKISPPLPKAAAPTTPTPAASTSKKDITIPGVRSNIDAIRADKGLGAAGAKAADAFTKFYDSLTTNRGTYVNKVTQGLKDILGVRLTGQEGGVKEYLTSDSKSAKNVLNYMYDRADGLNPDINSLSADEQKGVQFIDDFNLGVKSDQASRPGLPKSGIFSEYFQFIPSRKVIDTLVNKPASAKAAALIKDFYAYQATKGKTAAEAKEMLDTFKAGYSKGNVNVAEQFGPIDKSAGVGIPRSWREDNLIDAMARYSERVARRFAYHDSIESNPDVMTALTDGALGVKASSSVQPILDDIGGIKSNTEAAFNALGGVIKAGILGPLTGSVDYVGNFFIGWQHMTPTQVVKSNVSAVRNMNESLAKAYKTGRIRENIGSVEFGDFALNDITNLLRRSRDVIADFNLRNGAEKLTRATAMGQGRYLIVDNFNAAKSRNLSSVQRRFLDTMMPDWRTVQKLTPDMIDNAAAKFVDSVQGTYDNRGLPEWAQNGLLSPFVSLARWNIEKLNNYTKHVVTPLMKEGDVKPLLMQTLGTLVGGAAINEIREQVTGRKGKSATFKEIFTEKNAEGQIDGDALAYRIAVIAAAGGMAGQASDLVKSAMDLKNKNRAQTFDNPLFEAIEANAYLIKDVVETLSEGDVPAFLDVAEQIVMNHSQAARIALNNTFGKEDTEKANALRDLRVYRQLKDQDVADIGAIPRSNKLKRMPEQEFKKETDPEKIQEKLPTVIGRAFDRSKGDVKKFKEELKKLKTNSYQTMPNINTDSEEFVNYFLFLEKTQGREEAVQRLQDYLTKKGANDLKSKLIP